MKEISEKAKKEKERPLEKKKSLELTEDNLNEEEEKARQKLSVADELLKDATSKLDSALASKPINTNSSKDDARNCKCKEGGSYG